MEYLLEDIKKTTDLFFKQANEFIEKQKSSLVGLRCDECDCKYQGIPGQIQKCDRCLNNQ